MLKALSTEQMHTLWKSRRLNEKSIIDVESIVLAMQDAGKSDQPAAERPSPQLELEKAEARIAELEDRNIALLKRGFELQGEVNETQRNSRCEGVEAEAKSSKPKQNRRSRSKIVEAEAKSSKPSEPPQIEDTFTNAMRFIKAVQDGLPRANVGGSCLIEANKILTEQHARK